MYIDGQAVFVGDAVYAINFNRTGNVTNINSNTMTVTFEEGGKVNFRDFGLDMAGNKVLFWHKPAMNNPRKGDYSGTAKIQSVINQLENFLVG